MNRSTFWMIKYMNGSVFSKARYMNGVGFEILARTPVPKLPLSYPPPPPPPPRDSEIGWDTFACRRNKHKNTMFYKMYHGIFQVYLPPLFRPNLEQVLLFFYNLGNPNTLQTIESYSQFYQNSFLPSAMRTRNALPEETKIAII